MFRRDGSTGRCVQVIHSARHGDSGSHRVRSRQSDPGYLGRPSVEVYISGSETLTDPQLTEHAA